MLSSPPVKRVTLRQVAEQAGVSLMSVSLAFKPDCKLSASTRDRILKVAESLHYIPNSAARQLRYGRSDLIGLVINEPENPFYARMAKIAAEELNSSGFTLLIQGTDWSPSREASAIARMLEMNVAGLLLCSCEIPNSGWNLLRESRIPAIAIDTVPESKDFPLHELFINDCRAAGRMMAEHFAAIGVRHPAFISAAKDRSSFSAFHQMFGAFESTCADLGIPVTPECREYSGLDIEAGIQGFQQLVARQATFDGLFCANDLCAYGVIEVAESFGRTAGRNLAVAGIDDLEVSRLNRLQLTSLRQPGDQLARSAARHLINLLSGKSESHADFLPPILMIRQSTSNFERTDK